VNKKHIIILVAAAAAVGLFLMTRKAKAAEGPAGAAPPPPDEGGGENPLAALGGLAKDVGKGIAKAGKFVGRKVAAGAKATGKFVKKNKYELAGTIAAGPAGYIGVKATKLTGRIGRRLFGRKRKGK
jgi:hypothetical protein